MRPIWTDVPLRDVTGVERAIHEEYRATYGRDPLLDTDASSTITYPRRGISRYLGNRE